MSNKWYGWTPDVPDKRDAPFRYRLGIAGGPTALLPSVDLRTTGFLPPVFDQGDLGSCHDANTEVLTEYGWTLFSNLTGQEKLASVDPATANLIYEKPVRLIRLPFKGELIVGRRGHSLDFRVTPDHNMLVRKWDEAKRGLSDDYTFVEARHIGWYSGLMNHVSWAGSSDTVYTLSGVADHKHKPQRMDKSVSMTLWLMFLGVYLAEGTLLKNQPYKIQIAASKEREKTFVRRILGQLGVTALELPDRFTFENRQIYEEMTHLGLLGVRAPYKFIPPFVFSQSVQNMEALLYGHFMGDGAEQNGHRAHYTSSAALTDDLQRLIFICGHESHISVRDPRNSVTSDGREIIGHFPEYRVSVCEVKPLSIERSHSISREPYEGEVFCAEMPTYHTLVTRRNYRILVSGNCTANALSEMFYFVDKKQGGVAFLPSRLFIYYNERVIEDTVASDAGAMLRTGIKVIVNPGACIEYLWPYRPELFDQKPPDICFTDAQSHEATVYRSVIQTQTDMRGCLSEGFPFVGGISVYDSFESDETARTGIVPMPGLNETLQGGHATLFCGYLTRNGTDYYIGMNSWGRNWGMNGFFYLPASYLEDPDYASDFWMVHNAASPMQGSAETH